jgi:hypothetical protein
MLDELVARRGGDAAAVATRVADSVVSVGRGARDHGAGDAVGGILCYRLIHVCSIPLL